MQGVEKSHCNSAIEAIMSASYALGNATIEEALQPIPGYGKNDTLGLDAMPEIRIIEQLHQYDHSSVIITEETGEKEKINFTQVDDPRRFRTVFISDPTDRSAQLKAALEKEKDKEKTVFDVIHTPEFIAKWEEDFEKPVSITGCSSAITCVRRGIPIFSVILNYLSQQIFLACSAGCYSYNLPQPRPKEKPEVNLDIIFNEGKKMIFSDIINNCVCRFATFLGKNGYKENFEDSIFMAKDEMNAKLHYGLPGGPTRVLYLSTLQKEKPVGFIIANGEKITEWIHWLPYVSFAKKEKYQDEPALRLFEVHQDRPYTKNGILMSTSPTYSIFKKIEGNKMVIDVSKFASFSNPSRIRSTLILAPANNAWITSVAQQYGYRSIELNSEQ
jgi:hypothetical protein